MSSRSGRFLHSVVSGYALIGAQTAVGLLSVPLVLAYLPRREFGLWILVSQVGIFISMVDAGLSTSVSRLLTDARRKMDDAGYARYVKTCWVAQTVQGACAFLLGCVLSVSAAGLFGVDVDLHGPFRNLLLCQALLVGLGFATRIVDLQLYSLQHQFVSNYAQVAGALVSLGLLAWGLQAGWGLYSLPAGALASWGLVSSVRWVASRRLTLWPRGVMSAPWSLRELRGTSAMGRDVFLVALGSQLILSSQAIILTRACGVDTAAVWAVATRVGFLMVQMVWMFFDQSMPALFEMAAQGERDRLGGRFRELTTVCACLGAIVAVLFACSNGPLLQIWTRGVVAWPDRNNALFGCWLFLLAAFHPHTMCVIVTKQIGFMRWIYLFEGATSTLLSLAAVRVWGLSGMIVCFLASSLVFHGPYGLMRSRREFGLSWRELAMDWYRPALTLAMVLVVVGYPLQRWTAAEGGRWLQLIVPAAAVASIGMALLPWVGLSSGSRRLVLQCAADVWRRVRPS